MDFKGYEFSCPCYIRENRVVADRRERCMNSPYCRFTTLQPALVKGFAGWGSSQNCAMELMVIPRQVELSSALWHSSDGVSLRVVAGHLYLCVCLPQGLLLELGRRQCVCMSMFVQICSQCQWKQCLNLDALNGRHEYGSISHPLGRGGGCVVASRCLSEGPAPQHPCHFHLGDLPPALTPVLYLHTQLYLTTPGKWLKACTPFYSAITASVKLSLDCELL